MAKRKGVGKRLRFEIFKRDGFRCVYCGATPLQVPLHADHVKPVAVGGDDSPSNLVTACGDCNMGKAAVPLTVRKLAEPVATTADRDHAAQILEYLAIQRDVQAARDRVRDVVADRWEELVGTLNQVMYDRLARLAAEWPMDRLEEAMQITARKLGTAGKAFSRRDSMCQAKYFQAILRNWREAR